MCEVGFSVSSLEIISMDSMLNKFHSCLRAHETDSYGFFGFLYLFNLLLIVCQVPLAEDIYSQMQ